MFTLFQKSLLGTLALAALLLALVIAAKAPAQATTIAPAVQIPVTSQIPPGIVTTGEATVRIRPDAAILTAGAVVQGATAEEAQAGVSARVATVLDRAKALGIEEKDTKTVAYRIEPLYAYEQGKAPKVTGYQGTQQIALTLHGVERVGKAIDTLLQNDGATTATVTFTLLDSKSVQAAARTEAIQDARAKAEAMARNAGVTLGKVLSVSDIALPVTLDSARFDMAAKSGAPAPAQIPAGELQLVVRVQVQFEIG